MPFGIGPLELVVVLVVVLLIFGPKRLPGLGKQLGSGMRDFKDEISKKHDAAEDDEHPSPQLTAAQAADQAPTGARVKDAERS